MNKRKGLLKLISLVCVIAMAIAVALLPASAIDSYRTANNGASSSYRNGKYYQNLMKVPLTGDGVTDVLAVALSQMGYAESNSADQMSGTVAGSSNYTEFNYNFGDITQTNYKYEWCASFCSWALWQARVTPDGHGGYSSMCRNHLTDGSSYYWRETGCDNWATKLKNMEMYGYRGSYTPKSGDLIFFNRSGTIGHIGLVVWCDGSTVYTIEGNTSSGAGIDGNGGGTYYKSYSLGNVGINGYGKLPYVSNDVTKVDYSGKNKTAGLYMAKEDFWVSPPVDADNPYKDNYKIPRYDMFRVAGFDGQYAIIEYGTGRYYGNLNSNTIQISADQHQHSYEAGKDATHHYQICEGCGDRQNVVAHSYTQKHNDTHHYMECECGYKLELIPHTLEYVIEGENHKRTCECGYVEGESEGTHSYDVLDKNENEHYYRCECGQTDETTVEKHVIINGYDEKNHFRKCEVCGIVVEGSAEAHRYDISTNYERCECGYDRSGLDDGHDWEISYDGENHFHKCAECGEVREGTSQAHSYGQYRVDGNYHYYMCECGFVESSSKHEHVYDREGFVDGEGSQVHLKACVCGVLLEGTEEAHYYNELKHDENGHWFECVCGFKSEVEEHTRENGTCTECSHHAHQYSHDEAGHWLICDCEGSGAFEEHTLDDGRCTACGFETEPTHTHSIKDGLCTECGYHKHTFNFDKNGHWYGCGCYDGCKELREHTLADGKCTECGYVESQKILHQLQNGTCTECGYHEHVYLYDANAHKNICDCYLSGKIDRHTFENGKCTACGYSKNSSADTGDGAVENLTAESTPGDVSDTGCQAAMGAASVAMSVILALGCGISFKKKED